MTYLSVTYLISLVVYTGLDIYIFQQEKPKSSLMMETAQEQENSLWINFDETNVGNCMISYGLEDPFNDYVVLK